MPADPIDANTLAFWPCDELINNIRDRGSYGITLGEGFNGPQFDGTNDAVNMGSVAALRFERNQPFSISFYATQKNNSDTVVVSNCAITTRRGYSIVILSSGVVKARLISTVAASEAAAQTNVQVFLGGNEAHITVTYDGSSSPTGILFYVNGLVVAKSGTVTNTLTTTMVSTGDLCIGKEGSFGTPTYLNGTARQVAIWNRVLTAPECLVLASLALPDPNYLTQTFSSALVGWWQVWRADTYGGVSGGILDRSTGGHHGTGEGGLALYTGTLSSSTTGPGAPPCGGPRQALDPLYLARDHGRWFNITYGQSYLGDSSGGNGSSSGWASGALLGSAWTIEGWIYVDRDPVALGRNQAIIQYESTFGGGNMLASIVVTSTRKLRVQWESSGPTLRTMTSTGDVPTRQWVHFAVRGTLALTTRTAEFFIAGVAAGTVTGTAAAGGAATYTNGWQIGDTPSVANQSFYGAMSYLRVSRSGRTNAEIVAAAVDPLTIVLDANTVQLWKMQTLLPQIRDCGPYGRHAIERGLANFNNPTAPFDFYGVTGPNFVFPGHQFLNTGTFPTYFDASYSQLFADAFAGQNEATIEAFVRPDNSNSHIMFSLGGAGTALADNVFQWSLISNQRFQIFYEAEVGISWYARSIAAFTVALQSGDLGKWYQMAVRKKAAGLVAGFWKFDGVDDSITMGDQAVYGFERTTPFSGVVWVNTSTLAVMHLMGKTESDATPAGWQFSFNVNGNLVFRIENAAGQKVEVRTTSVFASGQYAAVGFTYTGSSTAAGVLLYVNGASQGTAIVTNTLAAGTAINTAPFTLGRRNLADQPFNGYMMQASVWNRVLTPTEMAEAAGTFGRPPINLLTSSMVSALIGYWKLDAIDTALLIDDYSVSAKNGVAGGGLGPVSKLCSTYDFIVNGLFLETVGPLPDPVVGDVYAATGSQYFMSIHQNIDLWSLSRMRVSNIARTDFELYEQFLQGSTGEVPATFEVIPISPTLGTTIAPDQALVFDVKCSDPLVRIVLAVSLPGYAVDELAYAEVPAGPNSSEFRPTYSNSTIGPVVDPGFVRFRFTLRRNPLWPDSPTVSVYAFAQGTEL